jgi:hypothetical protein
MIRVLVERDPVDNPAVIHDHQRQKIWHDVTTRLFVFTSFPWQPGIRFSYSRSNESSRQVDSGPAVPGSPFDAVHPWFSSSFFILVNA